ncbi:MAG: hypothetical protein J3R72DRAFT_452763 [Linnemannia gamsii]|nr:MAG: hypothetical protein J3R72DRAFT_452763 [Linnemannia gamsii]
MLFGYTHFLLPFLSSVLSCSTAMSIHPALMTTLTLAKYATQRTTNDNTAEKTFGQRQKKTNAIRTQKVQHPRTVQMPGSLISFVLFFSSPHVDLSYRHVHFLRFGFLVFFSFVFISIASFFSIYLSFFFNAVHYVFFPPSLPSLPPKKVSSNCLFLPIFLPLSSSFLSVSR